MLRGRAAVGAVAVASIAAELERPGGTGEPLDPRGTFDDAMTVVAPVPPTLTRRQRAAKTVAAARESGRDGRDDGHGVIEGSARI